MPEATRIQTYSYSYAPRPQALRPRYNGTAIAAFVVAFFASAVGLVLGYVALSQIRQSQESGRALALAAVILGWVGTVGFLFLAGLVLVGSWVFKIY